MSERELLTAKVLHAAEQYVSALECEQPHIVVHQALMHLRKVTREYVKHDDRRRYSRPTKPQSGEV